MSMPPPILITGAARSGTSMIAGSIHKCGAFGGMLSPPNRFNKKGMFENAAIRNNVVKIFLRGIDADPMGQNPLPSLPRCQEATGHSDFVATWRNRIERIMREQGYVDGSWFYKGAKMCLMWPVWHAAFPDAQWIIVRRQTEEIIQSCMHTAFMRAYRDEQGWKRWVAAHLERFEQMFQAGLSIHTIWPSKMIDGDLKEIKALIEKLDLTWRRELILDFIAPALWKKAQFSVTE